jgi:hypothetical protein
MRTVLVVNRHKIGANRKRGLAEPVLRVSRGKHGNPSYVLAPGERVRVTGELVYDPAHPLKCGAELWLECDEGTGPDTTASCIER